MSVMGKVGIVKDFATTYRFHSGNLVTQERSLEEVYAITNDVYVSVRAHMAASGVFTNEELRAYDKETLDPVIKGSLVKLKRGRRDLFNKLKLALPADLQGLSRLHTDPIFVMKIFLASFPRLFGTFARMKRGTRA